MIGRITDFPGSSFTVDNDVASDSIEDLAVELVFEEKQSDLIRFDCEENVQVNNSSRLNALTSSFQGVDKKTVCNSWIRNYQQSQFRETVDLVPNNNLPEDVETEGRMFDKQRDPPGQKSIYILPGDDSNETYRLSSFMKYPEEIPIDVCKLAAHGFLYTGYKDRVKCFSCGSNIQGWCIEDDPTAAKWHFNGCKLVLGVDPRNKSLGNRQIIFSGSFETSRTARYENIDASTSKPKTPDLWLAQNGASNATVQADRARGHSTSADEVLSQTFSAFQIGNKNNLSGTISYSNEKDLPQSSNFQNAKFESYDKNLSLNYPVNGLVIAKIMSTSHKELLKTLNLHKEQDRRKSFAAWKFSFGFVTPFNLAECGFFYLGDGDRVQCFSCSIVICNWLTSDTVEKKHQSFSPSCRMVLKAEVRNIPMLKPVITPAGIEPPDPDFAEAMDLQRLFPCLNPVNPHMKQLSDREQTFDSRWPRHKILAPTKHIAKAGFFFLGDKDRAKCFYCNGGLQNWDPEDEPFTEHAKWFPGCEFILRCKGVEFVKNIVAQYPNLKRPQLKNSRFNVITGEIIPQKLPSEPRRPVGPNATHSGGSVLANFNPLPSNDNTASENGSPVPGISDSILDAARSMGFVDDQIQRAVERRGREFDDLQELIDELLQNDEEEAPTDDARSSPISPDALKRRNDKPVLDEDKQSPCEELPSKKHKAGALDDMHQALTNLEYQRNCKHCHRNVADSVIIPCGHLSICGNCSEQGVKKCPICKCKVQQVIKAYLA